MEESKERHLIVKISWQSDGWKIGPTVEDMMNSTMSEVQKAGKKIYELLKKSNPEENEEKIKKTIVTEELLEKIKEQMSEEDKQSIFLPLESKLFNLETDIEEEDSKKWKKTPIHLVKDPKDFDNEKGIIFFASNKQLVGLYAFAKLYLENKQHYIKAPLEYCIKFDIPISFDEFKNIETCLKLNKWGQGVFIYINDRCALQILETAYKRGNKFVKLQDIINTLKKEIGEQSDKKLESGEQKEGSKKVNSLTLQQFFQYKGFYFDQPLITAFYAALKTKGFVILSGLTGTGKTKLAQLFAELLCPNCNPQDKQNTQIAQASSENQNQNRECTHLFLPVRPDWRDSKALLGYYNPITGKYERTPLLDFILNAINNYNTKKDNADPYFIILDEMNLSHVEYYFADFLSVLESGRDQHGWTKETIKLHNVDSNNVKEGKESNLPPKEINLPPNLYIIGSVNIDETTYMFSPKVLDRAFTIEFRDVDFDSYNPFEIDEKKAKSIVDSIRNSLLEDLKNKKNGQARFCGAVADKEEIKEALNWIKENKVRSGNLIFDELKELNQILQPYDLHFGYRVLDEIALFIKYATDPSDEVKKLVGKLSPEKALDFAVLMKVLPKFHGPRQKLEKPLWLVLNWCLRNDVEFDNKTFDDLIKGIWKKLSRQDKRPSIEDFTYVIQKLKSELNNRRENVSQEANPESQRIGENQNQATEESPESTSEAYQTEQTSKDEKTPIIDNVKYPRTAIKVLTMLRQLYETGFTSFA
jgi:5-methylcytosine-specific restriction endonuclease McrBC GTP-binding regulatory subunit McrB